MLRMFDGSMSEIRMVAVSNSAELEYLSLCNLPNYFELAFTRLLPVETRINSPPQAIP